MELRAGRRAVRYTLKPSRAAGMLIANKPETFLLQKGMCQKSRPCQSGDMYTRAIEDGGEDDRRTSGSQKGADRVKAHIV